MASMAPLDGFTLRPQMVAMRDLDGLSFAVVVLRVRGFDADVAYLDDGNIECGVPEDELADLTDVERSALDGVDSDMHFREGIVQLAEAEKEHLEGGGECARPSTATMRWEDGRHVTEDGAVIISSATSMVPRVAAEPSLALDSFSDAAGTVEMAAVAFLSNPDMDMAMKKVACGAGLRGIRWIRKARHEDQTGVAT